MYRYSIVPGGVWSEAGLADAGMSGFHIAQLRCALSRYVSYEDGGAYWTSAKLTIPAREFVWVGKDGRMVRARCGNHLSAVERSPELPLGLEPMPKEFDETVPDEIPDIPLEPFFPDAIQMPETQIASTDHPAVPVAPVAGGGIRGGSTYPEAFLLPVFVPVGSGRTTEIPPAAVTPEPDTLGLCGLALLGLWIGTNRKGRNR